ncbi:MAG: DUF839 domain-containing protein [Oligoflexia bacterium]|nr:DUF839 domain-containing protein [Oligoflexia bacterium]
MEIENSFNRREFLTFMGKGLAALSVPISASSLLQACSFSSNLTKEDSFLEEYNFQGIYPSNKDSLILANGLRARIVLKAGDLLSNQVSFGYNNDHIQFFTLAKNEGLLCVNHEYPHTLFQTGSDGKKSKTREQVITEMRSLGVSVVHVKFENDQWKPIRNSTYNRRLDGLTKIPFDKKGFFHGETPVGTIGNCAGGKTPWNTYLTCEENYDVYYGEIKFINGKRVIQQQEDKFRWYKEFPHPPEHYGWVVEIDPLTGKAKKLTGLGRFAHEGATVVLSKDGYPVVYMGDDASSQFIYKFVSNDKRSLENGTLYVADTENGKWLALDRDMNPKLGSAFKTQEELLIRTREAAALLGATPQDRPEDIEVSPIDGSVYVALTKDAKKDNYYGAILKIIEANDDAASKQFSSSIFLLGGEKSAVACPDNMVFDKKGNLWITTDMSGDAMNKPPYEKFKNNGLFFVPMHGPKAGLAFQVASAPIEAELTGPCFSADGKTLFLSVQHPGEETTDLSAPTSNWPDGGNSLPKPSVVAISGDLLDTIIGE